MHPRRLGHDLVAAEIRVSACPMIATTATFSNDLAAATVRTRRLPTATRVPPHAARRDRAEQLGDAGGSQGVH